MVEDALATEPVIVTVVPVLFADKVKGAVPDALTIPTPPKFDNAPTALLAPVPPLSIEKTPLVILDVSKSGISLETNV